MRLGALRISLDFIVLRLLPRTFLTVTGLFRNPDFRTGMSSLSGGLFLDLILLLAQD
jgi:hypothetical protein